MIQLPSIQIDTVVEDASFDLGADAAIVANRNPQPDEVQVPRLSSIEFDHIMLAGTPPDPSDFLVTVNDVVAVTGGSLALDWDGELEAGPAAGVTHFSLKSPEPFEESSRIEVRVWVGEELAAEWAFTASDHKAPRIVSTVAVNKDQILVLFSEPVVMQNAALEGDALAASSYMIERVTRPAATPPVVRVDRVSDVSVMLTTGFELTFGAGYMLVASGVQDEFDNAIAAPDNVSAFSGFLPPYPPGRRFLLHDFVPAAALDLDTSGDLRLFLACLQDSLNLVLHTIDAWGEILDPDDAPESFLDAMLADLGNPFDFELDVTDKRKLVKLLVRIYELKGTEPGIIDVVRFFLGIEVTVETFNGAGWRLGFDKLSSPLQTASPAAIIGAGRRAIYSFRVRTDEVLNDTQRARIFEIAQYMKGVQEHLVGIRDGSPAPEVFKYWKLSVTKLGYAKIAAG